MDKLEAAVIDALIQRAEAIAHFADVGTIEESSELQDLRAQLADLESMAVIPNRIVNPAISEALRTLRDEIQRLEQQFQLKGQLDSSNRELLMLIAS
jgi:hypothetical protein